MIVVMWRGKGWMVAVVTFLSCLNAELWTRLITRDEAFYGRSPWPFPLSLLASSLILHLVVQRMKTKTYPPDSPVLDDMEKPRPHYRKYEHTFLRIPMEYWVISLLFFAMLVFLNRLHE